MIFITTDRPLKQFLWKRGSVCKLTCYCTTSTSFNNKVASPLTLPLLLLFLRFKKRVLIEQLENFLEEIHNRSNNLNHMDPLWDWVSSQSQWTDKKRHHPPHPSHPLHPSLLCSAATTEVRQGSTRHSALSPPHFFRIVSGHGLDQKIGGCFLGTKNKHQQNFAHVFFFFTNLNLMTRGHHFELHVTIMSSPVSRNRQIEDWGKSSKLLTIGVNVCENACCPVLGWSFRATRGLTGASRVQWYTLISVFFPFVHLWIHILVFGERMKV